MFDQNRTMIGKSALVIGLPALLTACAPSLSYRSGQGFYSDQFAQQQVQDAAKSGQVQNLGRFEIVNSACFNYTQVHNNENVVIPAVQRALQQEKGNAADRITAKEEWYDFGLGLVVVPAILGCSVWTVSGDALRVKEGPMMAVR